MLDELTLYRRDVLETLRTPLEQGVVRIARSGGVISYPCRFSLVGAMNPCACGYLGDSLRACRCSERQLELYRSRLSGPLLDRFDICVTMARLAPRELLGAPAPEGSATVRARVETARDLQTARYGAPTTSNASAKKSELERAVAPSDGIRATLGDAIARLALSARGVDRVLRVARTLADLDGGEAVTENHVVEALAYRSGDADLVAVP